MNDKLEAIARLKHGRESERIHREINAERRALLADFAKRGFSPNSSGFAMRELMELQAKAAGLNARALVDIWTDLLIREYGTLTSEHTTFINQQVQQILAGAKNFRPQGQHQLPDSAIQATQDELARTVARIGSSIARDLEIMRREQDVPPLAKEGAPVTTINYNISGYNARLNINSTDNSTNTVTLNEPEFFAKIREAVTRDVQDTNEQHAILDKLSELEAALHTKSFGQKYGYFMSAVANHMTVILPFLPVLQEMLQRALT